MKKSMLTVGLATTLMVAWAIGRVQGQQDQSKGKVIFASADQANFHEMGNGVAMAPIWGDSDKGAHATFTKFRPGFDAGMHTHTRSEEHTSELQSRFDLVCRLLLEKKKKNKRQ